MSEQRAARTAQHQPGGAPGAAAGEMPANSAPAMLKLETTSPRRARIILPWLISFALHGALVLLGFVITWTVVMLQDAGEPSVIVADFDAMRYEPVESLDRNALRPAEDSPEPLDPPPPTELSMDPLMPPADIAALAPSAAEPPLEFATSPPSGGASFLGVRTTNAERIAYVIDASGTMIAYIQLIVRELARSLDALSPEQSFGIVFFQRSEALAVPPRRLVPATETHKRRALSWIEDNIIPAGISDPVAAFEAAFAMQPEVIFVLSANITGAGIYEIDQADLLARLDELNPEAPGIGRRPTQINCIQFLDPDPIDTLRVIADRHGGENGYRFLSRQELGIAGQ